MLRSKTGEVSGESFKDWVSGADNKQRLHFQAIGSHELLNQEGFRLHQFLEHETAPRKLASEPFQFPVQRTLTVGDIHEVPLEVSCGDLTGINYCTAVYQRYRFKRTGKVVLNLRRDDLKSISAHANAPM
jgi:hypothetical protein